MAKKLTLKMIQKAQGFLEKHAIKGDMVIVRCPDCGKAFMSPLKKINGEAK